MARKDLAELKSYQVDPCPHRPMARSESILEQGPTKTCQDNASDADVEWANSITGAGCSHLLACLQYHVTGMLVYNPTLTKK